MGFEINMSNLKIHLLSLTKVQSVNIFLIYSYTTLNDNGFT